MAFFSVAAIGLIVIIYYMWAGGPEATPKHFYRLIMGRQFSAVEKLTPQNSLGQDLLTMMLGNIDVAMHSNFEREM